MHHFFLLINLLEYAVLSCSVMSDSLQPHRRQPTRLPRPWDSPGKNTGVGCHFLLQCLKVKSDSEVAQSCPAPSDPMDCSLPGSSIHGIFQAWVRESVAIAFSPSFLNEKKKKKLYIVVIIHMVCLGMPSSKLSWHTLTSHWNFDLSTFREGLA